MLPVPTCLRPIIHLDVTVFTFDFFIVIKAEEILQLGEVLLMSRHEIIHIVNAVICFLVILSKSLVCLLSLSIARKKEHLVDICQPFEVSSVVLEHFENFGG